MVGNRQADISQATRYAGAIDCDLHPAVPGMSVLMPYLDDYWREMVSVRALDRLNLSLTSYPQNAPLSCRPDWTLDQGRKPGSSLEAMQAHVLNSSSHEGASLCKGRVVGLVEASEPGPYQYSRRGELIRCPWHGWEFDLRTGKSWCEPDRSKVRSYELKVEPGVALVEGGTSGGDVPGFDRQAIYRGRSLG
jgi:nitrite reductase/ring-hydroxylating ferredoxin subunit